MFKVSKFGRRLAFASSLAAVGSACGASAAETPKSDLVIAVEYGALFFPYHTALKGIIDRHAKELGGITIIDGDSAQDTAKELNNVENFLMRKPDCIVLMPVDYQSPAAAEAANGAKVPFVSLDMKAGGPISAFVGYGQEQAGDVLGQFVIDEYKKIGKPKIKLMYLRGIIGHPADTARDKGLKAAFSATGLGPDKLEIIEQATDFNRAKAESIATSIFTQNPDIDVVVGNNDDIVLGVKAAADARGIATGPNSKLHLIGVDGIPEMLQAIADGKIDATAFQNPIPEARKALDTCVALAKGQNESGETLKFTRLTEDRAAEALKEVGPIYKK
jgi:ABC-type sugar transport system substrate-binding protein